MKLNNYMILLLGLVLLTFTACSKEDPDFYDGSHNGVYFTSERYNNINFANYPVGNPDKIELPVRLKLLGYLTDESRKAVLRTKPIEEYPEAEIVLPEVTFSNKEYEKEVTIDIIRPTEADKEYAICVYLDYDDPEGLGAGITGNGEVYIYVKESYEAPQNWGNPSTAFRYLGEWTPEKYIFIANALQDNNFANEEALKDEATLKSYNQEAVKELRRLQIEGETINIDIPFNNNCMYEKPEYWGELHNRYLGEYSNALFIELKNTMGVSTINEFELLSNEDKVEDMHKQSIITMMNEYNLNFSRGLSVSAFEKNCWYPMYYDVDYDVVQPACWTSDGIGGGAKPTSYYGEYSDEKYKFMIKTWIKKQEDAGNKFMLWQMFPLKRTWGSNPNAVWDDKVGGEEAMKECYKAFIEAYSAAPEGTYNFSFPEIVIE